MIQIIRAKSPEACAFIEPHLQIHDDVDPGQEIEWVRSILLENPDRTFLLLAFDDEDKETLEVDDLVAFALTVCPQGRKHTFILQAWAKPGFDDTWGKRMFLQIVMWSHDQGRSSIRGESKRSISAALRRWNFKEHSINFSFDIPDEYEEALMNRVDLLSRRSNGSNNNAEGRRNKQRVGSDGGSTEHSQGPLEVYPGEGRQEGVSGVPDRPTEPVVSRPEGNGSNT
jgi:hypothetical protein